MKNSGIAWVGLIPTDWSVTQNRAVFNKTKNIIGNNWVSTQLLSLTKLGIIEKDINDKGGKQPESFGTYQLVKPNDLVLCLFDIDISAVFSGISRYYGMISPAYNVIHCNNLLNPNYADYWFQFINDGRKFLHYSKNIRYTLSFNDFSSLPLLIPPINEQTKIVATLQNKISKIDSLIDIINLEIEKIREYKNNVIYLAVSRGLSEKLTLKNSGLAHIGSIPNNWEIYPLKALFDIIGSGSTPTSDNAIYYDGGINWIQSGDLGNKYIETTQRTISSIALDEFSSLNQYQSPFLTMAMYGASIGNVSISKINATTNQACCVLSKPRPGISLDFIYYSLLANRDNLTAFGKGGTQPNISQQVIKPFRICIPPYDEQLLIVDFLDKKIERVDLFISLKLEKINKLQEYKKSLIYEYVTGKKEIRE